jgi:hypothetical protein
MLRQAAASGLSLAAFARSVGVSPNVLYGWRDRLRTPSDVGWPAGMAPLVNISAAVPGDPRPALVFAGGVRLEYPHLVPESDLVRLLQVLAC